jgi:hypothetical protein
MAGSGILWRQQQHSSISSLKSNKGTNGRINNGALRWR